MHVLSGHTYVNTCFQGAGSDWEAEVHLESGTQLEEVGLQRAGLEVL